MTTDEIAPDTASKDLMAPFIIHEGDGPLVISAPHISTYVPSHIAARMTTIGRAVSETDFHVHQLFDFAKDLGASTLFATHSRYVIDLNRNPDSSPLYPGQFETPLCPLTDFDLRPLYTEGFEPTESEINQRRQNLWWPYHSRLEDLLEATKTRHGYALLIDAHSIRPSIPALFDGVLPKLNFGTYDTKACGLEIITALKDWQALSQDYTSIIDGRFKGGFTTRAHGRPEDHIHALQIEIVQDTYLDMACPERFDPDRAKPLSQTLEDLVKRLLAALKPL
jgi:N-formylglutamate deformylase